MAQSFRLGDCVAHYPLSGRFMDGRFCFDNKLHLLLTCVLMMEDCTLTGTVLFSLDEKQSPRSNVAGFLLPER